MIIKLGNLEIDAGCVMAVMTYPGQHLVEILTTSGHELPIEPTDAYELNTFLKKWRDIMNEEEEEDDYV